LKFGIEIRLVRLRDVGDKEREVYVDVGNMGGMRGRRRMRGKRRRGG
jgi:hypothetical protein